MKLSYTNAKYGSGFPAADLRFADPDDKNFAKMEFAQSEWKLNIDGEDMGSLYLESHIPYARDAFLDSMQEFEDADSDARLVTMMEAMLYRRMLMWDERSCSVKDAAMKAEFLDSLNGFLKIQPASRPVKDMIVNGAEMIGHVNDNGSDAPSEEVVEKFVYQPDETDMALRQKTAENATLVNSRFRALVCAVDAELQHEYDCVHTPFYDSWSRTVIKNTTTTRAKTASYKI